MLAVGGAAMFQIYERAFTAAFRFSEYLGYHSWGLFLLALTVALGYWFYRRQRRRV
jgi:hypothetical protein